jgi:RNA polymerase sigma-70 factor (ECF subfamily)
MNALVRRLFPEAGDADLVRRIRSGETALFGELMRRHNGRLFRIARAILRDDADAEDVLQEAYVRAFEHLGRLEDLSAVSPWLSRIVVNEAKARLRRRRHVRDALALQAEVKRMAIPDPEQQMLSRQLRDVLAGAIDALPLGYRTVFVLREIEGLDTKEVGSALGIREEAVKTRLHRARAALRRELYGRIGAAALPPFRFGGERCDRLVTAVLRRIAGTTDRST